MCIYIEPLLLEEKEARTTLYIKLTLYVLGLNLKSKILTKEEKQYIMVGQ